MADVSRTPVNSRRRQRRHEFLVVGGVLALLAAVLAYAARDLFTQPAVEAVPAAKPQSLVGPMLPQSAEPASDLVDDDGQTLWVSPTDGPPLDLAGLPPGTEFIVVLRPQAILAHQEGEKVLAALGPLGQTAVRAAEKAVGRPLVEVDRLLVGWAVDRAGRWQATLVDLPTTGPAPPLARDVERILSRTDSARQVTIMFPPRIVLGSENRSILPRNMLPLRGPLEWFLGDDVAAVALSMNWGKDFFIELVAVPTLDSSPERMSDELAGRVNELPELVEEFVFGLEASPYGRRVVARLPEMVRRLAAYTRHGFDNDTAVLRCYLPAVAGHNLLMGAELAIAEGQGRGTTIRPLAEASSPGSIAERLRKKTSLRFAREELEAALNMLADDVGVEIIIRGQDLQLDGITRNQLFGIDMTDRRAEEILVEILRRANPDKLATGPADSRQKLVYVVGPEAVFVTTRAGAAGRGEQLLPVYQPK